MSYQGKILLFNDSRNRTHLIFNHHDPNMTQIQIHNEIKNLFGLDYKFGSGDEMATVYNSGNVLTEICAANTPQQMLTLFGEVSHPDVVKATPLVASDVRIILYTKLEPPYGNTVATQGAPGDKPRGGRYYKTNYALSDPMTGASNRVHSNNWDGSTMVRYSVSNTAETQIAQNPNISISDTQLAFTNVNERSDTGGQASSIDAKPKSIFYVYSRIGNEFLRDNFNQDSNRVYNLVKPYLIGGDVVATTTQELEQAVLTQQETTDNSFNLINDLISNLQQSTTDLNGEISDLKQDDQDIIQTQNLKETIANVSSKEGALQDQINTINENIESISKVISATNTTLHNFYNYQWTNWSPPSVIDNTLKQDGSISMVQLATVQSRVNNRQAMEDTAAMLKNVRSDIVKLAKINTTVLELLNDDL